MRSTLYAAVVLFGAGALIGCDTNSTDVSGIDEAFLPYVERFVDEAELREARVDVNGLEMNFTSAVPADTTDCYTVVGLDQGGAPSISISTERDCWARKSDPNREALVFHTLGHAFLSREEVEDVLPDNPKPYTLFPPPGMIAL